MAHENHFDIRISYWMKRGLVADTFSVSAARLRFFGEKDNRVLIVRPRLIDSLIQDQQYYDKFFCGNFIRFKPAYDLNVEITLLDLCGNDSSVFGSRTYGYHSISDDKQIDFHFLNYYFKEG